MRNSVYFGHNSWRFWYLRYKDSPYYFLSIIVVVIIVCLVLFVQVIIPQTQDWLSVRAEVIATQQRIAIIKENIQFIKNLDRGRLNSQLQTAVTALPVEKDFNAVLGAVSSAARQSGASVDDFSFQIGDIASGSAGIADVDQKDLSSLRLTVSVGGKIEQLKRFIEAIQMSVPLSQVVDIEGNEKSTLVTIVFYQKAFPSIQSKPDERILPLSDANSQLLDMIAGWKVNTSVGNSATDVPVNSKIPLF